MKGIRTVLLVIVLLVTPILVSAAGLVPCGGPGEPECQFCYVVDLINNVVGWLVLILSVIVAIIFVVSGFKLITSGGNVSAKEEVKKRIVNTFIGFVIVLSAWLLIDFVVKSLLSTSGQASVGPWNAIQCIDQSQFKPVYGVNNNYNLNNQFTGVNPNLAPNLYAAGDCSPANLQSLGMTAVQSQVFSCMAQPESGCNLKAQNGWTSARGVFQITRGWNDKCHNLNLPACSSAAQASGYAVSGSLNCSTAFSGGSSPSNPSHATPGKQALFNACNVAASNMACNTAAALCLYNDGGGYGHWLGNANQNHHQKQRACVAKYGG